MGLSARSSLSLLLAVLTFGLAGCGAKYVPPKPVTIRVTNSAAHAVETVVKVGSATSSERTSKQDTTSTYMER